MEKRSWLDRIAGQIRAMFDDGPVDAVSQAAAAAPGQASPLLDWSTQSYHVREGLYYTKQDGNRVLCKLCPNYCGLGPNEIGKCLTRKNIGGRLYTVVYGLTYAMGMPYRSPIFPLLYHTLEGQMGMVGLVGCGLRCSFCFAWQSAQADPRNMEDRTITPEWIMNAAKKGGIKHLHFTNNEPTNNFEYTLDVARMAQERGMTNSMSTAGYVNSPPLTELSPLFSGYVFGLKGFSQETYTKYTQGHLQPILKNMLLIKKKNLDLEISYLLIPGASDRDSEVRAMARWVKDNLGRSTPIFFNRFYPLFKLKHMPPTPVASMIRAREICREEGLIFTHMHVPVGDREVLEDPSWDNSVYCPYCGKLLVEYKGAYMESDLINNIKDGRCVFCSKQVPGLFQSFLKG